MTDVMPVRLVEWNVAMSLRTKCHLIAALEPTIAVLPESAHPDKTRDALDAIGATAVEWVGGNANKGLSVVAFDGWQLRIDDSYDPGYQWVVPIHATGPAHIRLLAVWDMNHRGKGHASARQSGACRASMSHYADFLAGDADLTLISGDFNNSVYWDKPTKRAKFGDFMDELEARGFASAYHSHYACGRGAEPHPTLWWMKNVDSTYHIDYTFASPSDAVVDVTVGTHSDWLAHSDHSPMTVDLRVRTITDGRVTPTPVSPTIRERSVPQRVHPHRRPPRTSDTHAVRLPLAPGALPDMACGVNGKELIQMFRPTSVTAKWTDEVLVDVKIWGPRILKDGSLGTRELDHRFTGSRAGGGVVPADLPPVVAELLKEHVGSPTLRAWR